MDCTTREEVCDTSQTSTTSIVRRLPTAKPAEQANGAVEHKLAEPLVPAIRNSEKKGDITFSKKMLPFLTYKELSDAQKNEWTTHHILTNPMKKILYKTVPQKVAIEVVKLCGPAKSKRQA
jgi:hypothetical protein